MIRANRRRRASVEPPNPTLYTRVGDLFGWLCLGAVVLVLALSRRARKQER